MRVCNQVKIDRCGIPPECFVVGLVDMVVGILIVVRYVVWRQFLTGNDTRTSYTTNEKNRGNTD